MAPYLPNARNRTPVVPPVKRRIVISTAQASVSAVRNPAAEYQEIQDKARALLRWSPRYTGALADSKVAEVLAGAIGHAGTGAEYLLRTVLELEQIGRASCRERVLDHV